MPVGGLPALAEKVQKNIHSAMNMVYTCFGRRFTIVNKQLNIEKTWSPSKEDRDFMVSLYRLVEKHLADETLETMPIDLRRGGLNEILNGIAEIRDGHVHGKKLVYSI